MKYKISVRLTIEADSLQQAKSNAAAVLEYCDEDGDFGHISGVGCPRGYIEVTEETNAR